MFLTEELLQVRDIFLDQLLLEIDRVRRNDDALFAGEPGQDGGRWSKREASRRSMSVASTPALNSPRIRLPERRA